MIQNIKKQQMLLIITSVFSLTASLTGVIFPRIYDPVVSSQIRPGVFAQDLVVILAAVILFLLAITTRQDQYRKMIVILGILGFLFYAYGIYAIEQIYTPLYLLYLAILGMSFYALLYGFSNLDQNAVEALKLPRSLRFGAAGYSILIALIFNLLWISQLLPLMQSGERIEYTFSVYIIDLVFIMPAFVITALMAIGRKAVGLIGQPALFFLGAGILSPLAIAEVIKPARYGLPFVPGDFWLFTILSALFLILGFVYLITLRPERQE